MEAESQMVGEVAIGKNEEVAGPGYVKITVLGRQP